MTLVLALTVAAVSASPPSGAGPEPRRVVAPSGVSFTVPPGFSHSVEQGTSGRVDLGAAPDGVEAFSVGAPAVDADLRCDSPESRARALVPFSTARGLDACATSADAGPGGIALALVLVRAGRHVVPIAARGRSVDAALRLARAVADSVAPPASRPRPVDPRVLGCFELFVGGANLLGSASHAAVRCYRDDGTFTQRWGGSVTRDGAGTFVCEDEEDGGTWRFDGAALEATFEDGRTDGGPVQLRDRGMLVGDRSWARVGG